MSLRLKRAYEPASPDDGERYLVERLWPRGVSKERAHLEDWLKDLAPSPDLRRWFGHEPGRWDEFRRRYEAELNDAGKQPLLRDLSRKARSGRVTLVYAASDTEHNSALVLRDYLQQGAVDG